MQLSLFLLSPVFLPVPFLHFPPFSFHCCPAPPNSSKLRIKVLNYIVMLASKLKSHAVEAVKRFRGFNEDLGCLGGRSVEVWGLCHQEACSLLQPWHHCSIPFHGAGTTETPITLLISVSCSPSLTHSCLTLLFTLTHIDQERKKKVLFNI